METFLCIECGWISQDNSKSILHMKIVHNMDMGDDVSNGKFVCDICNFKNSDMAKMKDHMIVVHEQGKHQWWTGNIKIEF